MVSPVASEMIWPVVAVAHRVCQNPAVGGAELSHQFLFVIMGDQGDIHVIRSSLLWIQIRIRGIRCPMMRRAIFS